MNDKTEVPLLTAEDAHHVWQKYGSAYPYAVVNRTKLKAIADGRAIVISAADLAAKDARITELETRLEINSVLPSVDGIYCRDETIRLQYEEIESLRRDAERYRGLKSWLKRQGLLALEECQVEAGDAVKPWWLLWPPYGINRMVVPIYSDNDDATIDAAIAKERRG